MEELIVDGLACHRIARLIVTDEIFDRPRAHLMTALHAAGYEKAIEGLRCTWCTSVYVAFGVAAARALAPRAWQPVARALALADVAGIVSSTV